MARYPGWLGLNVIAIARSVAVQPVPPAAWWRFNLFPTAGWWYPCHSSEVINGCNTEVSENFFLLKTYSVFLLLLI